MIFLCSTCATVRLDRPTVLQQGSIPRGNSMGAGGVFAMSRENGAKRPVSLWNGPPVKRRIPPLHALGASTGWRPSKCRASSCSCRSRARPPAKSRNLFCATKPRRSRKTQMLAEWHRLNVPGLLVCRQAGNTFDFCSPKPAIPKVTTSPPCKYCCGDFPMPTPGGVPVEITSPACRLMNWLQ